MAIPVRPLALALFLASGTALAQPAALPSPAELRAQAARRYPQPVRAGDLVGRTVLQPLESKPVLGRVTRMVRLGDGTVAAILSYGGLLGLGTRQIAVPTDALTLLSPDVEVVGYTPAQLDTLPRFDGTGAAALPDAEIIWVGLSKPSH